MAAGTVSAAVGATFATPRSYERVAETPAVSVAVTTISYPPRAAVKFTFAPVPWANTLSPLSTFQA